MRRLVSSLVLAASVFGGCVLAAPGAQAQETTTTLESTTTTEATTTTTLPYSPSISECSGFGVALPVLMAGGDAGLSEDFIAWISEQASNAPASTCLQLAQMVGAFSRSGEIIEAVDAISVSVSASSTPFPDNLHRSLVVFMAVSAFVAGILLIRSFQ